MAKDLGYIETKAPTRTKTPLIPRIFRNRVVTFNIMGDEAVALYGKWSLRALADLWCCGTHIVAGSTFQTAGNHAVALVQGLQAEFVDDASLRREEAALAALDEINKERVTAKGHPAFAK